MPKQKLVIAEKPSVGMVIAKALGCKGRRDGYMIGGGYIVSWCIGHLAGLADASVYDPSYAKWRWADLPIIPENWRFTLDKNKTEQFDILRNLMRREEVTEVINACDAGREGELIFRTAYHLAGCTLPMKRLWISSMEDSAIREGFDNLRPGSDYDGLYKNNITQIQNKIVFWVPDRHCTSPLLKAMFQIISKHLAVTIRYSSINSESIRTIIPIGLYAMNGLWYCPAYCTKASQIREFRIDRIKEIIEEKPYPAEKYAIPASIQNYLEKLEIGNDYHIKIKLTDIGVKRCETEFLLAKGLKVFPTGDGIVDMEIQQATLDWVANFFLSFGNNATVLEPMELIQLMKTKSEELYKHYCTS